MSKKHLLNFALISALISSLLFSVVGFSKDCNEMYQNIIRIRVIANSNSTADQELKLLVRDAVLNSSKTLFNAVNSYEDAVIATTENSNMLLSAAKSSVFENGYSYDVSLEFKEEYFPTREYDDFSLPAGKYQTAVFTIGDGKGENWWCVIYPQVCVGSCSGKLNESLSAQTANTAYNAKKYKVKFKTVEVFESVKKYFKF